MMASGKHRDIGRT